MEIRCNSSNIFLFLFFGGGIPTVTCLKWWWLVRNQLYFLVLLILTVGVKCAIILMNRRPQAFYSVSHLLDGLPTKATKPLSTYKVSYCAPDTNLVFLIPRKWVVRLESPFQGTGHALPKTTCYPFRLYWQEPKGIQVITSGACLVAERLPV